MILADVIACFPCTGKTSFAHKNCSQVVDHDIYDFKYGPHWVREDWLGHYYDRMRVLREKYALVLVNAVPEVVTMFVRNQVPMKVLLPDIKLKHEYLGRAYSRSSSTRFMDILNEKWESWINVINAMEGKYCTVHKLESGVYFENWYNNMQGNCIHAQE